MWSPRDHVAIPDPAARVSTAVVIPLAQEVAAQKTADSDDLVISENQLGPAGQSAVTSSVSASLYCEICPQTALRPYPFMSGHDTSRTRPPSCRIDFDSGRAGCRELLDESSARCPRINTHQVVWKSSYHASPLAERGSTHELAATLIFLASDAAGSIAGQTLESAAAAASDNSEVGQLRAKLQGAGGPRVGCSRRGQKVGKPG